MITFQWNFQIRTKTFVYHVIASWVLSRVCAPYQYIKIYGSIPLTVHEALEGGPKNPVSLKLFRKVSLKSYIINFTFFAVLTIFHRYC